MSQSFLIFALPRSRTAWLATMLTGYSYGTNHTLPVFVRHLCKHDWIDLKKPLPGLADFNGATSTGAQLHWQRVLELNPGAKIVTIRRKPLDAVLASYERATGLRAQDMWRTMSQADAGLDAIERHLGIGTGCLSVRFNDIDDRAEEIHRWCLPGVEIDHLRLDQLKTMQIQMRPSLLLAEIAKLTKGQGKLAL